MEYFRIRRGHSTRRHNTFLLGTNNTILLISPNMPKHSIESPDLEEDAEAANNPSSYNLQDAPVLLLKAHDSI